MHTSTQYACSSWPRRLLDDHHFSSSEDAEGARGDRIIGIITIVVILITMAYIIGNALYRCLQHDDRQPEGDPEVGHREMAIRLDEHIDTVRALSVVVYGADGETSSSGDVGDCPVCLEEYLRGDEVRMLPGCHHRFHRKCIDQWLLTRALTCPMCRGAVTAAKEAKP